MGKDYFNKKKQKKTPLSFYSFITLTFPKLCFVKNTALEECNSACCMPRKFCTTHSDRSCLISSSRFLFSSFRSFIAFFKDSTDCVATLGDAKLDDAGN